MTDECRLQVAVAGPCRYIYTSTCYYQTSTYTWSYNFNDIDKEGHSQVAFADTPSLHVPERERERAVASSEECRAGNAGRGGV